MPRASPMRVWSRPCWMTSARLRRVCAARAKMRFCDELAYQLRPAEDPRRRGEEGCAGESLAQMPELRPDAVPPRPRGESLRLRQLRPSLAARSRKAAVAAVR